MEANKLFAGTIQMAERALDLRARRHELILSNIANADTPNYKAFDLFVEEALAKQSPPPGHVELKRTQPGHMPAATGANTAPGATPRMVDISPQTTLRGDGNTVDMDREMSSLASNQIQFKAAAQILAKKFQSLQSVIQGGKG